MTTLQDYRDRGEHWSYSSLHEILAICSLRWAFAHIDGLVPEFRPSSLSMGSVFHRVAEWVAHSRKEGKRPRETDATDLFSDLWPRQLDEDGNVKFDDGESAETCAAEGRAAVACFTRAGDENEQILSVNAPFCVALVDAGGKTLHKPLVGEMDCIVQRDATVLVVDWKLSSRRWPKDKAHRDLQPCAYLWAAQQVAQGKTATAFRYDVVVRNKTPVIEQHVTTRTTDQFHRLAELARAADRIIAHQVFVPNETGMFCKGCGYQSACKQWHRSRSKLVSMAA